MAMFPVPTPASGLMAAVEGVKAGGSLIGAYFQNKEKKMMYDLETKKLKEQTRILLANIDAQLEQVLDENNKRFAQEMMRLKTIASSLESNHTSKKALIGRIDECLKIASHPECSEETRRSVMTVVEVTYSHMLKMGEENMQMLKLMQSSPEPMLQTPPDSSCATSEEHIYTNTKERS
ncbi:MAG: hypothetical protein L3J47_12455 [Sulfurovum sp.]|nr:hypothetical protein [Sulfurovum sp.]